MYQRGIALATRREDQGSDNESCLLCTCFGLSFL